MNLPGGTKGNGGHVSLGKGVFAGDDATIEIWGRSKAARSWARVFECRSDDNSAILMMSWSKATDNTTSKVSAYCDGTEATTELTIDNETLHHISVRFKKNSDGTTTITWTQRNSYYDGTGTGEVTSTVNTIFNNNGEGWSFDRLATAELTLGYSPYWPDNDAEAVYFDVRIWHGALSDAALELSAKYGSEATDEQIAAIAAKSAETLTVERKVAVAAGAVLDLGGATVTNAVLSCGGTLTNGTLVVTKGLEVTVGQTMTVASGATLDISAVTDVTVTDPENLSGSGWNAIATDGGSLAVPADTLYPGGDLRAYKIMFDTGKVHVGPNGLMIIFK